MSSRHTSEGLFKQFIIDDLTAYKLSGHPIMFYAAWDAQKAIPDIVGAAYSRSFVFELKGAGTRAQKIQDERLRDWHNAGSIAGFLREGKDHMQPIIWYAGGLSGVQILLSRSNWLEELLDVYLSPKHSRRLT